MAFRGVRRFVRQMRSQRRVDGDVRDELDFHLAMRVEELRARGMSPGEARDEALHRFGDLHDARRELGAIDRRHVVGERVRLWGDALRCDLALAVRELRRAPAFAVGTILTIALGIGTSTAMFSIADGIVLRPLPFPQPDRLLRIWEAKAADPSDHSGVGPPTFRDWERGTQTLATMAAYVEQGTLPLLGRGDPVRIPVTSVSAAFFGVLGIRPAIGRAFVAEDDVPGAAPVAVVSDQFWRTHLGATSRPVGEVLCLNGTRYTIVGVMPREADYPGGVSVWIPLFATLGDAATMRGARFLDVIARMRPAAGVARAEAELRTISSRIVLAEGKTDYTAAVQPLGEALTGKLRPKLLALLGAVGFLLAIACVNAANLMLVRMTTRRREVAVRAALGAGRRRLVVQFFVEGVVLTAVATALGVLLARWLVPVVLSLAPDDLPRVREVAVNVRALGFAVAVAALTALGFSLAPAIRGSRTDVMSAIRDGADRTPGGVRGRGLRDVLVAIELALSVVLVTGAGLLIQSFARLIAVDPGFRAEHVTVARISLPDARYAAKESWGRFYGDVFERLGRHRGTSVVGAVSNMPLTGSSWMSPALVRGRPMAQQDKAPVQFAAATPGYFAAMGIAIVSGRAFSSDDRADGRPVAVVNEAFARRYFPGESPIGKQVRTYFNQQGDGTAIWHEVVGVVRDVRHVGLATAAPTQLYVPYAQFPTAGVAIVVRSDAPPNAVAAAITTEVRALDPDVVADQVATAEQLVSRSVAQPRFYVTVLGTFAALALLLAVLGVYGTTAYAVAQRTQEMGIRVALGARPGDVLRLVVGGAGSLAAWGVGLGLLGSLAATRALAGMLYGVRMLEPSAYVAAAVVLVGATLAASYLPARRASRADPLIALRRQ
jgi:putative ABC transport system permease protein